jgi:hypothetical protein
VVQQNRYALLRAMPIHPHPAEPGSHVPRLVRVGAEPPSGSVRLEVPIPSFYGRKEADYRSWQFGSPGMWLVVPAEVLIVKTWLLFFMFPVVNLVRSSAAVLVSGDSV